MRRDDLPLALALLCCVAPSACRGTEPTQAPCDAPLELDVVVDGGEGLNLGHHGEAWPAHIRLYQVGSSPDLATIDPERLAADDAALGVDLYDRRERVLYPDSHERWSLTILPETTHITVAALFHQPEPDAWGTAIPLPRPLEVCRGEAAPPICLFITVDGSELRGGAVPPPAFVGDGLPCQRLSLAAREPDSSRSIPSAPSAPSALPAAPSVQP